MQLELCYNYYTLFAGGQAFICEGLESRVLPYYCESKSVVNYGNNTRIYNKYLLNRYFIGFTAIYCPNNSRLPSPARIPPPHLCCSALLYFEQPAQFELSRNELDE